ncbi:MAG: DUF1566 domain-containing protein [Desulfarculaceae bacterium]|nr:DUF1566 domain-containing protein [Desulfarculaceae bacterium]MCF8073868.1 DUF1566 domain-containing protein [Desulfarculaceae bacterium]MCF8102848.1 DUF1566 domain-containing protein [Desulfarculaceae bacterium]MCF8116292.1 DUF1566 domain-containing protein [Desulfarculaceae bacterium]
MIEPGENRFKIVDRAARDQATGLVWSLQANPAGWPLFWDEAREYIAGLNQEGWLGHDDWRLPNRRELFSLMDHTQANPALPPGHPFTGVELAWYWSATPYAANPAYAWYVHSEGGRMFFGDKGRSYYLWPVRGVSPVLAATGAPGEALTGRAWPEPRWEADGGTARDRLSGLVWTRQADLAPGAASWFEAGEVVERLNREGHAGRADWRLPGIRELESLVDAGRAFPALSQDAPFEKIQPQYWSATTSGYDPEWAMALYLDKGGVGVGMKKDAYYAVWGVSGP